MQWCHVCNVYIIMGLPCWVTVWKSSSPEMCCVFFLLLNRLQVLESQHCCVATHQGATSKGGRVRGSQPDPLPKKWGAVKGPPPQKQQWHHCLVARLCVSNHLQFQPPFPNFLAGTRCSVLWAYHLCVQVSGFNWGLCYAGSWGEICQLKLLDGTVDGLNPANLGCIKACKSLDFNYQPQMVSKVFSHQ